MSSVSISGYDSPLVGYSSSEPWRRSQTNFEEANTWTRLSVTTRSNGEWISIACATTCCRPRLSILRAVQFRAGTGVHAGPGQRNRERICGVPARSSNQVGRDLYVEFPTVRQSDYYFFGQDKWVVSRKLTLDLGMRYEFWPAATSHYDGQFVNYNPTDNSLRVGGYGDIPKNLGINGSSHFSPRLGAAYRISEKTVLRAGYGISYLFRDTSQYNFPSNQVSESECRECLCGGRIHEDGLSRADSAGHSFQRHHPQRADHAHLFGDADGPGSRSDPVMEFGSAAPAAGQFYIDIAYVGNHGVNDPVSLQVNRGLVIGAGAAGTVEPGIRPAGQHQHDHRRQHELQQPAGQTEPPFPERVPGDDFVHVQQGHGLLFGPCLRAVQPVRFPAEPRALGFRPHAGIRAERGVRIACRPRQEVADAGAGRLFLGGWQVNGVLTAQTGGPLSIQSAMPA